MTQHYLNGSRSDKLYVVQPDDIDSHWKHIQPILEKAIVYNDGKHTARDIYNAVKSIEMQMFYTDGYEVVCVTCVAHYPRKRVLEILYVAGEKMERWLHHQDTLANWAKDIGCDCMEAYCRPGWEKVVDWEKIHTVLRRKL